MRTNLELFIPADITNVVNLSNNVKNWTYLFDNYKNVEILELKDNYVKFKLYTNDDHSWISERRTEIYDNKIVVKGTRLSPLYPFEFMNIKWIYEKCIDGTKMIWSQNFLPDESFPKGTDIKMKEYIEKESIKEMERIKEIAIQKNNK